MTKNSCLPVEGLADIFGRLFRCYFYERLWQCSHAYCKLHRVSTTPTMSNLNPYHLREKYTRFRILVIGRANAGKTTLLQRVCNTTEDPCIYDKDNKNLVSLLHRREDEFCFWKFLLAWTYIRGIPPFIIAIYYCVWSYSCSEGYMTYASRSHSRATRDLYFTILLDLRPATRSNCRMSCHFWRRKQSRVT